MSVVQFEALFQPEQQLAGGYWPEALFLYRRWTWCPFHTTTVIGWCKSSEKLNSIWKVKRSLVLVHRAIFCDLCGNTGARSTIGKILGSIMIICCCAHNWQKENSRILQELLSCKVFFFLKKKNLWIILVFWAKRHIFDPLIIYRRTLKDLCLTRLSVF